MSDTLFKLELMYIQNFSDAKELQIQEQKLNEVGIVLKKLDQTDTIFATSLLESVTLLLVLEKAIEEAQKEAIKEFIKYILKNTLSFGLTILNKNKRIELKNFDEIPEEKIEESLDPIFRTEIFKTENDYVIGVHNSKEDIWEFMTTTDYVRKYVIPKKSHKPTRLVASE